MKIDNRDVYEQIGNLFYAIAVEQHVKPMEVGKLKSLISKDWLPRNLDGNESVISDETHCILLTIDALEGSKALAQGAFNEFSRFYAKHPEVFTKELKQRIFDTAVEITNIFKADNPYENANLTALKNIRELGRGEDE